MNAASTIRAIRRRSRLGLRELARRAGTSHATLHTYERGTKEPRVDTVARIARAAGFDVEFTLVPRPDNAAERAAKGHELVQVLELAESLPANYRRSPDGHIFGRAT